MDESLADFDQEQVIAVIDRLMKDRRELLDKAIPDQDTYLQDLNELELVNQQMQEKVAEFREYLNQRVLWIRSTDFISTGDLAEARNGLAFIVSPARWRETMMVGGISVLKRPAVGMGLLAIVVLLVLFRTRSASLTGSIHAGIGTGPASKFLARPGGVCDLIIVVGTLARSRLGNRLEAQGCLRGVDVERKRWQRTDHECRVSLGMRADSRVLPGRWCGRTRVRMARTCDPSRAIQVGTGIGCRYAADHVAAPDASWRC